MPGLRRLRDPRRDAELHAGARRPARADRLRLGDRLRGALPVLHADLRDALDPRAGAGDRDGAVDVPSGPVGLGRDGRRRRALDRRQPPDPRAAPQRQPQDPALQQPDLRADEGPVLADEPARDEEQDDADGVARLPVQPALAGAGRGGDVRRALDRHRPEAPDRGAAARGRPSRARPSSRSTRTATSTTTAPSTPCGIRRRTGSCSKHGEPMRFGEEGERGVIQRRGRLDGDRRRRRASAKRPWSSTTSTSRTPRWRTRCHACRTHRMARRRSASSATSSARSTTR